MVKLTTFIYSTSLYLLLKLKLAIMVRGVIFPTCACCVRPITMHWVKAGQSEQTVLVGRRGFVDNDTFERGGA